MVIVAGGTLEDSLDDQRLAVSLGIPVLPVKFIMDQIIAESKATKRKEGPDTLTSRQSKRQRRFDTITLGPSLFHSLFQKKFRIGYQMSF
jgi:hypothetical protein